MNPDENYVFEETEKKRSVIPYIVGVFVIFAAVLYFSDNKSNNGIYPVGSETIYVAGESCTINTSLDRTPHQLHADFDVCVKFHQAYRAMHEHGKVTEIIFTEKEVAAVE